MFYKIKKNKKNIETNKPLEILKFKNLLYSKAQLSRLQRFHQ